MTGLSTQGPLDDHMTNVANNFSQTTPPRQSYAANANGSGIMSVYPLSLLILY